MLIPQKKKLEVKTGIIILCRYDSRRLPGKILMKIDEKEVLKYIYERMSLVKSADKIIVATSSESNDNAIAEFCRKNKWHCFRGPKDNVAKRILDCAKAFNLDYFVRISGDSPLMDPALVDQLIKLTLKGKLHLASNVKERSFPSGMSIEVLNTKFYGDIIKRFKISADREHVTAYLYRHEEYIGPHQYIYNSELPKAKEMKLSLDDEDDFNFISSLIENMKGNHAKFLLKDIYKLSQEIKYEKT